MRDIRGSSLKDLSETKVIIAQLPLNDVPPDYISRKRRIHAKTTFCYEPKTYSASGFFFFPWMSDCVKRQGERSNIGKRTKRTPFPSHPHIHHLPPTKRHPLTPPPQNTHTHTHTHTHSHIQKHLKTHEVKRIRDKRKRKKRRKGGKGREGLGTGRLQ